MRATPSLPSPASSTIYIPTYFVSWLIGWHETSITPICTASATTVAVTSGVPPTWTKVVVKSNESQGGEEDVELFLRLVRNHMGPSGNFPGTSVQESVPTADAPAAPLGWNGLESHRRHHLKTRLYPWDGHQQDAADRARAVRTAEAEGRVNDVEQRRQVPHTYTCTCTRVPYARGVRGAGRDTCMHAHMRIHVHARRSMRRSSASSCSGTPRRWPG